MAERIISPGVFTREQDLSYLPVGIAQLGAAIVGPTLTGPAMVPTQVTSYSEFEDKFGVQDPSNYTAYTAKSYLQRGGAPSATIVRTLGNGGFQFTPVVLTLSSSLGEKVAAVLMPTVSCSALDPNFSISTSFFTGSTAATTTRVYSAASASNISLVISGTAISAQTYSISLNPSDSTYITKVFGTSPNGTKPVYVALNFQEFASSSMAISAVTASLSQSVAYIATGSAYGKYGFTEAVTPWIKDQLDNDLFRFHTMADGTDANTKFKISIANIKQNDIAAGGDDVSSTYYTSFDVQVRRFSDTDSRLNIVESFTGVNLNKDSVNYIARRIGDKYLSFEDNGKVKSNGNYTNLSTNIYIEMASGEEFNITANPVGFTNLYKPFNGTIPTASFVSNLSGSDGQQNTRIYFGFDFSKISNLQYLNPSVVSSVASTDYVAQSSNAFSLLNCSASDGSAISISSSSRSELKFTVPFHSGFDGMKPYVKKFVGADITSTNVFGFDLSTATSVGTLVYKDALNILSNPDEIDINMLLLPGILHRLHSSVTNTAITIAEERGDVFYLMDPGDIDDNILTTTNAVASLDTNYVGTYYPWVKIIDDSKNRPTWVSPSVVMAGALAFNDRVSAEWFAPAGLIRGGLTEVVEVYNRLTSTERGQLQEGRVNPIASFPGQGVVAYGQKTLQAKPSALDRINVRRLIITLKKYIASSSRYLVFEQNNNATRTRFLNIVTPYLEGIQSRSGLTTFKVVMDESNNTAEVIDRNQLVGQIYIQPTRTAEVIILDFVVLPTGAVFPG